MVLNWPGRRRLNQVLPVTPAGKWHASKGRIRDHPTRRDVLKLAALLLPHGAGSVARARAAAWKKIPIGTQLWCVRKQLATDIPEP